jgi:retron-type reverse transcriptase
MSDLLLRLGSETLLTQAELMKIVRSAPRRYKVYDIPKRTPGKVRTIAQPAKEVKALQRWVAQNVLQTFPVHPLATGYRLGHSIADNARLHCGGRFLLKLDFENFFPSLKSQDFVTLIRGMGSQFTPIEIEALTRILFWKQKGTSQLCLSIGAPSSPQMSNILLMEFDAEVERFCLPRNIVYSRYADDMSLSADTSTKLAEAENWIQELSHRLKSPVLKLNREKTVRVSKREARRVTGLTITNDGEVSLGREQKRSISASVHHFATGRLPEGERRRLSGMLAYVKSVEPSFLLRLRHKYGHEVINAAFKIA